MSAPKQQSAKWVVIVNPAAGGGHAGRLWPSIEVRICDALPSSVVLFSGHKGHIATLLFEQAARGDRRFVVVGGDGSWHELVNGVMEQTVAPPEAFVLALLPVGTGNDWIRTHGIPGEAGAWTQWFAQATARRMAVGRLRYQDERGREQTRFFMNVAGLAYDGYVVRYTTTLNPPRCSRKMFYLLAILRCLFQFRPLAATLSYNGEVVRQHFYTIHAGLGRYAGGGMQPTPHARPGMQALALMYAGPVSRWGVIKSLRLFFNGQIGTHPLVVLAHTQRVRIEAAGEALLLEADGEFLGQTPVEIDLVPEAVQVMC
jgi:diacylglycerol kinase family enzyme